MARAFDESLLLDVKRCVWCEGTITNNGSTTKQGYLMWRHLSNGSVYCRPLVTDFVAAPAPNEAKIRIARRIRNWLFR